MLVFSTPTLIPIDAFLKFGLNSKPNTTSPIGFFGTGLKYAVAITLRLGGTFVLYRGNEEYEFYTRDTTFRGDSFQEVRMRKRTALGKWQRSISLPFTLELGKNWDAWMAVRELESNTRDENGNSSAHHEHDDPDPNWSMIVVNCPEMEQAYEDGSIFIDESLRIVPTESTSVEIREGKSEHIYMNGIRVYTPMYPTSFTYNITVPLELTEDRTPKYQFMVNHYILKALRGMTSERDLDKLFALDDKDRRFETGLDFDEAPSEKPSPAFHSRLDYAVHHGGGAFSRATSYHRSLDAPLDRTRKISVELTIQQWLEIAMQNESEVLHDAMKEGFENENLDLEELL